MTTHLDDHFKGEHSGEDVIEITQDLGGEEEEVEIQSHSCSVGECPCFCLGAKLRLQLGCI